MSIARLRPLAPVLLLIACVSCGGPAPTSPAGSSAREGVSEVAPGDAATLDARTGQTLYVPAYSSVRTTGDPRPFELAITLCVRNTDRESAIVLSNVNYHGSGGKVVKQHLKSPLKLAPLATMEFHVEERDTTGGTSPSFLVDWFADRPVSPPIVQTVMIGTASTQGISFLCDGRVIAERGTLP